MTLKTREKLVNSARLRTVICPLITCIISLCYLIYSAQSNIFGSAENGIEHIGEISSAVCSNPRVLLVGIDGMHLPIVEEMISNSELPNLTKLRQTSAWTFQARTIQPTASTPAWTAMIYGRTFNYFRNWIDQFRTLRSINILQWLCPKDNLFQAIKASNCKSAIIGNWPSLCGGIVPKEDIDFYGLLPEGSYASPDMDEGVLERTLHLLKNGDKDMRFIFAYFGASDHIAHFSRGGTESRAYKESLQEVDLALGKLMATITPEDYICVLSDHGQADWGCNFHMDGCRVCPFSWTFNCLHLTSCLDRETLRIPLLVKGPDIKARCIDKELDDQDISLSIVDVAPLILKLLDAKIPKVMEIGSSKTDFIYESRKNL